MAASMEKCYEFLNPNAKTVVVFNREILATDVTECIRDCVGNKVWPENSNVIILSGHHTSSDGKIGGTFSAFPGLISKHLDDLKSQMGSVMEKYNFCHIPIQSIPLGSNQGSLQFGLSGLSTDNIKYVFRNVLNSKEQSILIFATCFSRRSEVNDLINAYGLYPALFLSAEMGLVTQGWHFKLDKNQRYVLERVSKVTN